MSNTTTPIGGIDTSKATLDGAIDDGRAPLKVDNTARGWRQLSLWFTGAGVKRIGIEATGGYERGVVAHLRDTGLVVLVLQPMQVKAYARLHLRRAKNDRIDAGLIAACTAAIETDPGEHDPRLQALADALTFVEQIEDDIARWKTRIEHITQTRLLGQAKAEIKRLEARRDSELRHINKTLRRHVDLAQRLDLVLSVPGIGLRTALAIVLRMPELGKLDREQAAALAGLAPFDDDSGRHKGQRQIAGGRERLRKALYAAALPAAFRWNPALMALYARLIARGKPHKLALVACARKLIIFANTVVQRGTPWVKAPVNA